MKNLHAVVDQLESRWSNTHVVVAGDLMLDRYFWGDVERVSPESPVPIARITSKTCRPGGAANVAMNVAGLGGQVTVAGAVGSDEDGDALAACLREAGVGAELFTLKGRPTTCKLRVLSGQQQMIRLDFENTSAFPVGFDAQLREKIAALLPGAHALVLSDYAKGLLTAALCQQLISDAHRHGIPVLVDPKSRDLSRYAGATTICPNLGELAAMVGVPQDQSDVILTKSLELLKQFRIESLAVTMGERGIAYVREGKITIFPAIARQVFDVSGAGDTVVATLALAGAAGLSGEDAIPLANMAASIVVGKVGTVPVTKSELLASLMPEIELNASEKLLSRERLLGRVNVWRAQGDRIVFTNGCFDVLHTGHIALMEQARTYGNRLIVAINSDDSVALLKGPGRPLLGQADRGKILAALSAVDAVVVFDEGTPQGLIDDLRPDVIVKGGNYTDATVVGAEQVRSWGGVVRIVPIVEEDSTAGILDRIRKASAQNQTTSGD